MLEFEEWVSISLFSLILGGYICVLIQRVTQFESRMDKVEKKNEQST